MDPIAESLLGKLLSMGQYREAGVRQLPAALTKHKLKPYRELRQLIRKEAVEAAFKAARAQRLVALTWDGGRENSGGYIERVDLCDVSGLAHFLGLEPVSEQIAKAVQVLQPHCVDFPVLEDVLARWRELKTVRGIGAEGAILWRDAAIAIEWARGQDPREGSRAVRNASANIFRDSKRIEAITPAIDVLLAQDVNAPPREPPEVWAELGLAKEEQPVRLAGHVVVVRRRVTALLDSPYAAFPVSSLLAVHDESPPKDILTIENLTTFHQEAGRRCNEPVLLIYTGGAPSPAWRAMYARILSSVPKGASLHHWGDVDEGGFRIAAQIAKIAAGAGRVLEPYRMRPVDVPESARRPAERRTLEQMRYFARQAGWESLADEIDPVRGFTVEQEAFQ